jgi:hypothetical protein
MPANDAGSARHRPDKSHSKENNSNKKKSNQNSINNVHYTAVRTKSAVPADDAGSACHRHGRACTVAHVVPIV